jgi:hypothetical protein
MPAELLRGPHLARYALVEARDGYQRYTRSPNSTRHLAITLYSWSIVVRGACSKAMTAPDRVRSSAKTHRREPSARLAFSDRLACPIAQCRRGALRVCGRTYVPSRLV